MNLAIMQPYLFPYLGYFQMIAAADVFVSYDTVDYIQRGWINRNRILMHGTAKYFTVSVQKSPLGTPINQILINDYNSWSDSFLNSIRNAYLKAPHFKSLFELLSEFVLTNKHTHIASLATESLKVICNHLGIATTIVSAQELIIPRTLNRQERLEFLIASYKAQRIVLPPGSKDLYKDWNPECEKAILALPDFTYTQHRSEFVPFLSILDTLAYVDLEAVKHQINTPQWQ